MAGQVKALAASLLVTRVSFLGPSTQLKETPDSLKMSSAPHTCSGLCVYPHLINKYMLKILKREHYPKMRLGMRGRDRRRRETEAVAVHEDSGLA